MQSILSGVVTLGIACVATMGVRDALAQSPRAPAQPSPPAQSPQPVQSPPNELPAQKHERVALFGCAPDNKCEITCTISGKDIKFEKVPWAVVYKYPNATTLWLQLGTGPNAHYLLGDAFCDFTNMPMINPSP